MKYKAMIATVLLSLVALTTQAQTVEYIHTDALGSIVAVTDTTGAVVERREYEPYGEQLTPVVADGPGYTGHVQDAATGLVYMQQRYYDPVVGRFLSVDPVTADTVSGGNFNRYWYANNNPYRFTDPDGRESVGEMIDSGAEGCGPVSCAGWALAKGTWGTLGAEGVSQVYDKGDDATTFDKVMAGVEVATVGVGGKVGAALKATGLTQLVQVARAESLIGRIATMGAAGSKGIREVVGTAKDAKRMFDTLRAGNKAKEVAPGVFTAAGPRGGTVTFRAASKSGPPTVDVHGVVANIRKVKFLEPQP